jgi:hypothetical protein
MACGPYFPSSYVLWSQEEDVLLLPRTSFYRELRGIAGKSASRSFLPKIKNDLYAIRDLETAPPPTPAPNPQESTQAADERDLRKALQSLGNPEVDSIVSEYTAMRDAMNQSTKKPIFEKDQYTVEWMIAERQEQTRAFDLSMYAALLDRLPREFSLYVQGAAAYHTGDLAAATQAWRKVLELPEKDRPYRTTWAAFMLGKAELVNNPTQAIHWFGETQKVAQAGFADSLNLALASQGWLARAEWETGQVVNAIHRYFDLYKAGDDRQAASLSMLCLPLRKDAPLEVMQDALCRRLINTAYPEPAWFQALAELPVELTQDELEMLVWNAYRRGLFALAQRWLAQVQEPTPQTEWVRSKLLLRDGKIEEALDILKTIVQSFPIIHQMDDVSAEMGVIRLGRKEFVEAFDLLLKSRYWLDVAYLAERVLTMNELEEYLTTHQNDPAMDYRDIPIYAQPSPITDPEFFRLLERANLPWKNPQDEYNPEASAAPFKQRLHYLLARRYARQGEYGKAQAHYPEALQPLFSYYTEVMQKSKDTSLPKRERAQHLFDAALLTRWQGMELLGTEIVPDWALFNGMYAPVPQFSENRFQHLLTFDHPPASPTLLAVLTASSEEETRFAENHPRPNLRYHYRDIAVDLLWECATLLPDNDELLARALYEGGQFCKNRDNARADLFYKNLVKRCNQLPIGRQADAERWFPNTPIWDATPTVQ